LQKNLLVFAVSLLTACQGADLCRGGQYAAAAAAPGLGALLFFVACDSPAPTPAPLGAPPAPAPIAYTVDVAPPVNYPDMGVDVLDLASPPPKPDLASPPDLAIVRDFATPPPVVVKCIIDDKWKDAELPASPAGACASPVRLASDCSMGCPPSGKSADYIYPVYTRPLQGDLTHWELWAYSGAYSLKLDVGILPAGDCPKGPAYRFVGLTEVAPVPTAATVQGSTDLAEVYGYDPQYDKGVTYENCPFFGQFFTWGYKSQIAYKPAPAP
jgi:hypothetical protein